MAASELVDIHQIVKQPNRWSCLPCAAAMATGQSFLDILELIGHDGSEMIDPEAGDPAGRRAFDVQEVIYALLRGWDIKTVCWELRPERQLKSGKLFVYPEAQEQFLARVSNPVSQGIVGGVGKISGGYHAIAKVGNSFLDPNGLVYDNPFNDAFSAEVFWELF